MTLAVNIAQGGSNNVTFRNKIINGAMVIDQRNAGASVTPTNGQYVIDRFQQLLSAASKYSVQQNAGSVTPPAGFTNYLGCTSLSSYSVSSGDYFCLEQPIEGYNTADLAWGTANAKTVTLSFQVYSSLTGTFGGSLRNSSGNRSYPFTYTISSANTWTSISVTIAGDTTGTWIGATNGIGIRVDIGLGVGSTLSGTAGAWAGANYISATGATSLVSTNGATLYITGVQLEAGTTASPFEYRQYGTELQLCQRYYEEFALNSPANSYLINAGVWGVGQVEGTLRFSVIKRATPTMGYANQLAFTKAGGGSTNATPQFDGLTTYSVLVYSNALSGFTTGQYARIQIVGTTTALNASAEL